MIGAYMREETVLYEPYRPIVERVAVLDIVCQPKKTRVGRIEAHGDGIILRVFYHIRTSYRKFYVYPARRIRCWDQPENIVVQCPKWRCGGLLHVLESGRGKGGMVLAFEAPEVETLFGVSHAPVFLCRYG